MILSSIKRVIYFWVITLCLAMLPAAVSSSHLGFSSQMEETSRHNVLSPVDTVEHSHDDGDEYEQKAGHTHGHDPADHSHQVVLFSSTVIADIQAESGTPHTCVPDLVKLETDFGIDRPPKHMLFA